MICSSIFLWFYSNAKKRLMPRWFVQNGFRYFLANSHVSGHLTHHLLIVRTALEIFCEVFLCFSFGALRAHPRRQQAH